MIILIVNTAAISLVLRAICKETNKTSVIDIQAFTHNICRISFCIVHIIEVFFKDV